MKLSRRSVLAGSIAIPFTQWIQTAKGAGGTFTRYAANSPKGQEMLKSYATAVAKMMDPSTQKGNPRSWVFQWYTHCVPNNIGGPDPTAKSAAINSIYGSGPSPNKSLASEMWDTCQAHGGQREDFFLPWHRMYVYFFERIVRNVSGNPQFALPYWDYTIPGKLHGVIPPEFRQMGPLFKQNRNAGVNSGKPIDQSERTKLNDDSLKETAYQSTGGAVEGFCQNLDSHLHGQVHVDTGNGMNMGQVPYAAGDPVFWIHHANIDRFWASWKNNGGLNPNDKDFLNQTFVFADETGKRVSAKVSDFLDIAALGYQYDKLLPKPDGFAPQLRSTRTTLTSSLALTPPPVMTKSVSVKLSAANTRVLLAPPTPTTALATSLASIQSSKRLYLVARDINVVRQPGVSYDIFLQEVNAQPVGTINFFGLAHNHGGASMNTFWSVDVTDRAKAVSAKTKPGEAINAIIVPTDKPAAGAEVTIGSLILVAL